MQDEGVFPSGQDHISSVTEAFASTVLCSDEIQIIKHLSV